MSLFGPGRYSLHDVLLTMPVVLEMTESVSQADCAAEIGVPLEEYEPATHYPIFLRPRAVAFLDALHAGVETPPKGDDQ